MTMNTLPKFVNTINVGASAITAASTVKTIYTGTTEGSAIDMLGAVSTDSIASVASLYLYDTSAVSFQIGAVAIPGYSGTDGTNPAVNLMDSAAIPFLSKNTFGKDIINIPAFWSLRASVSPLTATKIITVTAGARDY